MAKKEDKDVVADFAPLLRKHGLKVTVPRLAILQVLATKHGPFTTEEILKLTDSGAKKNKADLVTVYRCLAKFEALGLIGRCEFGDGATRYELLREEHHHHHIICRVCKRVEEMPTCPMEKSKIRLPKTGFRDISHRLEFFGVCLDCHKKSA